MPKKKKTRKQKILADTRHKIIIERLKTEYQAQPLLNADQPRLNRSQQSAVQVIDSSHYKYVYSDLFKTIILTFLIIAGELALSRLFA